MKTYILLIKKQILIRILIGLCIFLCYQHVAMTQVTSESLQIIKSLYLQEPQIASLSSTPLTCLLTPQEKANINLSYQKKEVYSYANTLREVNVLRLATINSDTENNQDSSQYVEISRSSQSILMQQARNHNVLALLLALQLHFSNQCQRCERIREFSGFDFYYKRNAMPIQVLESEGISQVNNLKYSVFDSYVFRGEAFLCKALESKEPLDFLFAYSNLMLSGMHTRAINILLEGLKQNHTISYETLALLDTFIFLSSIDSLLRKNELAILLLQNKIIRIITKKQSLLSDNLLTLIQSLPYFKHIDVLEYNIGSNFIMTNLLTKEMESRKLLSPLNKMSDSESMQEFFTMKQKYNSQISHFIFNILEKATQEELQVYLSVLRLKERLRKANEQPYTTRLIRNPLSPNKL